MRCREFLQIVSALPEARGETLPAAARRHLQDCDGCRLRFAALRMVELGTDLRAAAPGGLAERIAERLRSEPAARRRSMAAWRWVPLAAAASLALALLLPLGRSGAPGETLAGSTRIRLTLDAPSATEVDVVGDWNGWDPAAQPMVRQGGRWEIVLDLERGRCYQYQFLVDGTKWIADPNAPARVDNGFGGMNSLLGS